MAFYHVILLSLIIYSTAASDVLEFTDSNFDEQVSEHDLLLIEFYAPWCGHCKKLAPEYEKAATILKESDSPVALAKVDCTAETKVCGKYGVSGYPTLKIFRGLDSQEDYNGPRESSGIVKHMRSKAGPSSKELQTVEEFDKFIGGQDYAVLGFFEQSGSELQKAYQKLADTLREDFRFAHTINKDLLAKTGHKDKVVIYQPKHLHSKLESSQQEYKGDASLGAIKTWLNENIYGLAGIRTASNSAQFKKPLVSVYYKLDYTKDAKGSNYWRNRVMKVAQTFKESGKKVYFCVVNKDDMTHELSEFGITDGKGDKPKVTIRDAAEQKYVMQDEFSVESLEKFVNEFLEGRLQAYLKSEPVPDNSASAVKVIVAKNFDSIVNDPTKDVLIEFYAPWCGHCKSLAPKYDELAEKMKDEEDIVIAKLDATANDVPKGFDVKGFPTLYFVPKGSKDSPKRYEGGREVDDFIKYLARESTSPLSGWTREGKKNKSKKNEL